MEDSVRVWADSSKVSLCEEESQSWVCEGLGLLVE